MAKTKGPITQVYLKHHPSGINWFTSDSTSSSSDDAVIGQILNNYLNGRNYVDSKGKLSFFRAKDITKVETKQLSDSLPAFDWEHLYGAQRTLTDSEKSILLSSISCGVRAKLRTYQQKGVFWLAEMRMNHHGCLLADEMGLGKTLQVLSHL